ncbi:MAG: hypothetical protein HOG76_03235 [Candidatus Marinimicrobia bacterium]|jgi:hypothetical protein|nr:hypothetical protein [Candidatus Neomarinimicrobiota bacterium]MBT3630905.1 hypothetical protein [Candidatus Neomarinimicrobiota bacterium]MBT4130893.1 hypothetical protein [Candidatus Neomarinimicrobiota bacterium]MBT4421380.1 hypothetical protein [Candidatus Neomarinimicrobiota bacterium]MBT6001829.1 hypothetical protein [Candidatus Neomarinimicrobiota bacterium]
MSSDSAPQVSLKYKFKMADSRSISFEVILSPDKLAYQTISNTEKPSWTNLGFHMCEGCKLADTGVNHCPVAVNLQDIVTTFKSDVSYDLIDLSIETAERTYSKEQVSMQIGLSSILGIIMVTSGCPTLDQLRPMVATHLPFASIKESIYRAMSMYLLAQFTRAKNGLEPDWTLKGLSQIYTNIDAINISMVKRLQAGVEEDASLNAVVILDSFAKLVPMSIDGSFGGMEDLFWPYLKDEPIS